LSLSSHNVTIPQGAARSAFDAAARSFEAARQIPGPGSGAVPLERAGGDAASVEGAIANAARQTGVDFEFLLAQARVESALNPAAKARTSSATGLYQFIDSTWLNTVKRHGARFGLGGVADAIAVGSNGAAYVADPARRADILALRSNPQIASWMAAGLAEDNAAHLMPILGRQPDHGELYLAHFLGAGGAGRFLSAMQDNPDQSAASLFAKAAAANPPIFYDANGAARSLAGVMSHLDAKIERAMGLAPQGRGMQAVQVAAASGPQPAWAQFPAAAPSPRTPYLIADEAVFAPWPGAAATGDSAARASARPPLSDVLNDAFAVPGAAAAPSPRAQAQVRRAYQQLRAFGL
jgi:hypothetical protein